MPLGIKSATLLRMLDLANITPMLLSDRRPPVPGPGWIYELKRDLASFHRLGANVFAMTH
jgi:hypothetical protein